MKACLTRLVCLAAVAAFIGPAPAFDLFRRDRNESAKIEPGTTPDAKAEKKGETKKNEEKDEKSLPAIDVEVIKDVAYRTDKFADEKRHQLDLYLPKGVKDFPVLLFVHGGSWRSGDKDEYPRLGELFAGEGIGAVVISYRLSPKVQHPAHIEDVASAFAWTHANIEKYGGRSDRIFACGHSAGGHLVALLATDDKYLKNEGLTLTSIRGVIPISGVHQINPLLPMFRAIFGKEREDCKKASPINHVGDTHPPFLLLYAEHDLPLLGRMSEELNSALKKNKCDAECVKMQQRNHMTIIAMLPNESDGTHQAIADFIRKHSEWKPPPRPDPKDEGKRESRKRDGKKKDG